MRSLFAPRSLLFEKQLRAVCVTINFSDVNIYINNTPRDIQGSCIADALEALNIPSQKGVAIAVNNNVIPRGEWASYELKAEDKMTLIKATQGG